MRQATLRKGVVRGAPHGGGPAPLAGHVIRGPEPGCRLWRRGQHRGGSDLAGKVTLGTGVVGNACTLTFTVTLLNEPACTAVNETNSGGHPGPVGTKSTPTTLVLDGNGSKATSLTDRDVVSYLYVGY